MAEVQRLPLVLIHPQAWLVDSFRFCKLLLGPEVEVDFLFYFFGFS